MSKIFSWIFGLIIAYFMLIFVLKNFIWFILFLILIGIIIFFLATRKNTTNSTNEFQYSQQPKTYVVNKYTGVKTEVAFISDVGQDYCVQFQQYGKNYLYSKNNYYIEYH